jgi:dTDP-4-amino-4,6-dideoxygalactose transaminase
MSIARKHKLLVIEDAAQSLGASFKGKKAGSFGLAGCYSFYPAKLLGAAGDGGLVVTSDKKTAEKLRMLRDHGRKTKTEISCYGFTSRLDNLQAAILNVRFKKVKSWISRRREIAGIYEKGLKGVPELKTPPAPESNKDNFDVFQNYVLKAEKRDSLYGFLKDKGIETLIKDPIPNHLQKGLLAKEVISLPMYPELSNQQISYVVSCLRDFYKKK